MKKKLVDVPVQIRAAAVAPGTLNEEERTVELVWSTGAAVRRFDWMTERVFIEELSMDPAHVRLERLNAGAPLLNTHAQWSLDNVLGVVESAWVANGEGRARVRFSNRPEVDPVWKDVADGIIRNVSVGYQVHKFRDVTQAQDKMKRLLAEDWEPMEISLVPVGADPKSGIRVEQAFACEIEMEEGGEPAAAPPAEAKRALEAMRRRLDLAEREI